MMSNKTYWNNRDKERFEYIRQNLADDKAFNTSLEKYYQRTIDAINRDIQSELQSFATRDGVSLAEARKKVSKADIRQFEAEAKKVVKEADKMRKKGKRVGYSDFSDEVNERMRLYNVTMRINRLEYLKSLIGVRLIELGVDINAELNVKLDEDTRKEFERQSGILAGAGMADAMDWWSEENVQKIIMSNTRSANFSTRIWSNIDVLKSELEKQLSRVLISGENPKATAKEFYKHMTKDVGNMRAAAERIARTESARCQTQATLESFKEYDVKYCRWIAEPRACVVCKEIASRSSGYGRGVYPVKDVPTLPQHPNCRCALSAHWIDEKDRAEASRLERKKNTEKRVTINKEKQRKLTAEFRKNGGKVWQGSEAEHYLKSRGAAAMTLGDATIVLQNKPTISEVLEELYHIEQFKNGEIDDDISKYKAEIEAQNYLLSVEKMYNIPRREIEETKRNLNYWKGKLENENK
jgi:SPP1 gp7 family putative phage head morphogenesis protein